MVILSCTCRCRVRVVYGVIWHGKFTVRTKATTDFVASCMLCGEWRKASSVIPYWLKYMDKVLCIEQPRLPHRRRKKNHFCRQRAPWRCIEFPAIRREMIYKFRLRLIRKSSNTMPRKLFLKSSQNLMASRLNLNKFQVSVWQWNGYSLPVFTFSALFIQCPYTVERCWQCTSVITCTLFTCVPVFLLSDFCSFVSLRKRRVNIVTVLCEMHSPFYDIIFVRLSVCLSVRSSFFQMHTFWRKGEIMLIFIYHAKDHLYHFLLTRNAWRWRNPSCSKFVVNRTTFWRNRPFSINNSS